MLLLLRPLGLLVRAATATQRILIPHVHSLVVVLARVSPGRGSIIYLHLPADGLGGWLLPPSGLFLLGWGWHGSAQPPHTWQFARGGLCPPASHLLLLVPLWGASWLGGLPTLGAMRLWRIPPSLALVWLSRLLPSGTAAGLGTARPPVHGARFAGLAVPARG